MFSPGPSPRLCYGFIPRFLCSETSPRIERLTPSQVNGPFFFFLNSVCIEDVQCIFPLLHKSLKKKTWITFFFFGICIRTAGILQTSILERVNPLLSPDSLRSLAPVWTRSAPFFLNGYGGAERFTILLFPPKPFRGGPFPLNVAGLGS